MARVPALLAALGVACSFDTGGPLGASPDGGGDGGVDGGSVDGGGGDAGAGTGEPSNGLPLDALDGANTHLDLTGNKVFVIDTDTGAISECGGPVIRAAGPGLAGGIHFASRAVSGRNFGIGAFSLDRLTIDAGVTVYVVGANAGAFLSATDVDIRGELVASGGDRACNVTSACTPNAEPIQRCGGPGSHGNLETDGAQTRWMSGGQENRGETGMAPNEPISNGQGPGGGGSGTGENGSGLELGGGGGGHASSGGDGGRMTNAGTTYGMANIVPLTGGSGGGGGGAAGSSFGGEGGGGGGALQITSLTKIRVHNTGKINVGGAGGLPGQGVSSNGGGGGGSGGSLLLEAPVLDLDGALAANGGGGGSGSGPTGSDVGVPGSNGGYGSEPTPGGIGTGITKPPAGGNGAAGITPATAAPTAPDGTGGGGGGAGRIRLRAADDNVDAATAVISPPPVVTEDFD